MLMRGTIQFTSTEHLNWIYRYEYMLSRKSSCPQDGVNLKGQLSSITKIGLILGQIRVYHSNPCWIQ